MQIELYSDEWYPVPSIRLGDRMTTVYEHVEIPDEVVARYQTTLNEFADACRELVRGQSGWDADPFMPWADDGSPVNG